MKKNRYTVIGIEGCKKCKEVMKNLDKKGVSYEFVDVEKRPEYKQLAIRRIEYGYPTIAKCDGKKCVRVKEKNLK